MRLLPLLALAQAAGIWAADRGWIGSDVSAWSGAAVFIVALAARPGPRGLRFFAIALTFLAGALSLALRLEEAATRPGLPAEPIVLEGRVQDVRSGPGWVRVDLDEVTGVEAGASDLPKRIRLIGEGEPVGLREFEGLLRGTRIRAKVRLRALREVQNPGSRGRVRGWRRAGIGAVGRLVDPALWVSRSQHSEWSLSAAIGAHRNRISQELTAGGSGSGLLRALALGDRAGLSIEVRDAFRRLGLSHLLAVSGLHLALVASLTFAAIRVSVGRSAWLAARWDIRSAALLGACLVAILYALYAGFGTPVRRALILLLTVALTLARGRPAQRAEPMAAAAMAILAFEPAALFEAGAQLSFAAAGALVFAARCPDRRERGWWGARVNAIETVARASATALAATAPIAGWHFGEVTPNGLLANLIAIPWTALLILPSALLCALVSGCGFTALAQVLLPGASWIATVSLEFALDIASRLPPPLFVTRPTMAWFLAVGVALLVTLRVKGTLLRVAGALLVVALLAGAPAARIAPPPPRLIALEVGQGSATIIQGRTAAVLVDAGASMPGGDWGKRAVLPALAALGIEALDLVVVSHGDRDHRGGVPSVLAAIPVAEVWVPYGAALDPAFEAVRRTARAQGAVLRERGAGAAPVVLGDLRVASLWPPARANGAGALDGTEARNDRSLVVGVEVGGHQLLIPGDLEMRAEKALIQAGGNLRAELLVLPHHGSRSSSSTAFLRAVGASVAIASAPCGGRFGMPHQEVLDRAKAQGVSVWWTGRDGAVLVALRDPLAVWGFGPTLGPDRCRVELQGRN